MKPDLKALEKLADHLANVPRKGFRMQSWCGNIKGKYFTRQHINRDYECGMTACVGGHATVMFPHHLKFFKGFNIYGDTVFGIQNKQTGSKDSGAIADAFNITARQAAQLTDPYASHQTPKAAARYIRNLIKRLEKETKS